MGGKSKSCNPIIKIKKSWNFLYGVNPLYLLCGEKYRQSVWVGFSLLMNQATGLEPIYTFIATVIIAPLLEELVFRLSIRKIFTSNILFIIT